MKDYTMVVGYLSFILGGLMGFIKLIEWIIYYINVGDAFSVAIQIIFSEILIVWYGLIWFFIFFVILFLVGLPFYGVYKLFQK